jgi:hypothetical protein
MSPLDQTFLTPLDPKVASQYIGIPPFLSVDGAANVRDLGNLQTSPCLCCPSRPGRYKTRSNRVFRSAQLSYLRPAGKEVLQALDIKAIFDFRSKCEIDNYWGPLASLTGSQVYHVPVVPEEYFIPEEIERREMEYEKIGDDALVNEYKSFLEHGGPSFGAAFRYMNDHPNDAILVHCASKYSPVLEYPCPTLTGGSWKGQDRSLCCIAAYGLCSSSPGCHTTLIKLPQLVGVPDETICHDYALSRAGLEPVRSLVLGFMKESPAVCCAMMGSKSVPRIFLRAISMLIRNIIKGTLQCRKLWLLFEAGMGEQRVIYLANAIYPPQKTTRRFAILS